MDKYTKILRIEMDKENFALVPCNNYTLRFVQFNVYQIQDFPTLTWNNKFVLTEPKLA